MEAIILGSGTCVPSLRRAGPGACLRTSQYNIMIDSAAGTLRQLVSAGINYDEVDIILYTHLHPDHVTEIIPYLFATKYAPGFQRNKPVLIMGGEGFKAFLDSLQACFGQWLMPKQGAVVIDEFPVAMPASVQMPPLIIKSAPTKHTPQSLAYRIEDENGKSAVFSGDTDYCEELIELAYQADLLVIECAAPEGYKVEGHLTPSECGRIAAKAEVKKLILTHFYPLCDQHDLITPCKKFYGGEVVLAEDLMVIPVCG